MKHSQSSYRSGRQTHIHIYIDIHIQIHIHIHVRLHEVVCTRQDTFSELRITCCQENHAEPDQPDQPDFTYIDEYIQTYIYRPEKGDLHTCKYIYLAK